MKKTLKMMTMKTMRMKRIDLDLNQNQTILKKKLNRQKMEEINPDQLLIKRRITLEKESFTTQ